MKIKEAQENPEDGEIEEFVGGDDDFNLDDLDLD